MMTEQNTRRRIMGIRFRLRTLMLLLIGMAVLLFLWAGPSVEQRRDVAIVKGYGFSVKYSEASALVPAWLEGILGIDFFRKVIELDGKPVDGKVVLEHVTKLEFTDRSPVSSRLNAVFPNVNLAILKRTEGDFEFLTALSSLTAIWNLSGLDDYPELPRLTMLDVTSAIEDVDCRKFKRFPNLKTLIVRGNFFNNEALGELSELETLNLGGYGRMGNHIDLQVFGKLTKLEQLLIRNESISSLESIANLNRLKVLELSGCTGKHDSSALNGMNSLRKLKVNVGLWEVSVLQELQTQLQDLQIEIGRNGQYNDVFPSVNRQKSATEK